MCRLFAPELIEAIATGNPPTRGAIEAVAAHIQRDWTAAGCKFDCAAQAAAPVCRRLALVAVIGPDDRHIVEATDNASGQLANRFRE